MENVMWHPQLFTHARENCQHGMGKDNIMNINVLNLRAGEEALQLRARSDLTEREPEIRALLLSMTPASGDPMVFYGLHRHGPHVHTPTHRHIHIINISTYFLSLKVQHNCLDYHVIIWPFHPQTHPKVCSSTPRSLQRHERSYINNHY